MTITADNVGVAVQALYYDGSLGVMLISDPDVVPETELDDLTIG